MCYFRMITMTSVMVLISNSTVVSYTPAIGEPPAHRRVASVRLE